MNEQERHLLMMLADLAINGEMFPHQKLGIKMLRDKILEDQKAAAAAAAAKESTNG